jgi:RND family efflux transporter MFP subunit
MSKKYTIVIALLILIIIASFAKKFVPIMFMKSPTMPPTQVSAVDSKLEEWQIELKSVGGVEGINSINIANEIDGRVTDINFISGQKVKKGDLLISLNDETEQASLASSESKLKLAKLNLERSKRLLDKKFVSQADYDQNQSVVDGAEADIKSANSLISKKNIKAPFSGIVGINKIKIGQYLQTGTTIVSLTDSSKMLINMTRPEQDLSKLKVGQRIEAKFEAYPDQVFNGILTAIDPQIDEQTRNINLQATIENDKNLLSPGMFAETKIILSENSKVITVPETAIEYSIYGNIVYIIENNKDKLIVKSVNVTIGDKKNDRVAIISGVAANQKIIANGQVKVSNGAEVVISDNPTPQKENLTNY